MLRRVASVLVDRMKNYGVAKTVKVNDGVEQDFPHFVDVVVPPGGLGTKLDAMYDFHAQHGIKPQRGHGRHDANGSIIRWCFADPALAAAFASKFSPAG
jgi:hypothetical protein